MDAVSLAKALIAYNSVSSESNLPLAAHLAKLLEELGMVVTRQDVDDGSGVRKQNVVGYLPPKGGTRSGGLMLAGHMDTVPFSMDQKATIRPRVDRGRLFGRGACDMKGGIAASIVAASRFSNTPLDRPLWLAFTCNEETGMHGARALASLRGLSPDHAVVAEPTELRPVRAHKAYWGARVELRGTPCHSSDPRKGVNALKPAVRALSDLEVLEDELSKVVPRDTEGLFVPNHATLNVGRLEAGTARNVVPGFASFTLELRTLPGQDPGTLFTRAESIIRKAANAGKVQVSVHLEQKDAALLTPADDVLVRYLEVMSAQPAGGVSFATEGHIYAAMGIPTVIFGPGSIGRAHRADEFVPTRDLHRAADILAATIQRFCVGATEYHPRFGP